MLRKFLPLFNRRNLDRWIEAPKPDTQVSIETNGKWFVWTKGGRRPRFSHDTHASALREAKRLAKKHPGKKFIVQRFHEKVWVA